MIVLQITAAPEGALDMDALVTLLVILAGLALIDPIGLDMARTQD